MSGLVVIDIDPRNGGDASYAKLREELPGAFTDLLKVRSGSGGTHLYFRHPGRNVPCRANVLPGIDVRADGGYIVAPPSRHASGARYRFVRYNGSMVPVLAPALCDFIIPPAQAQPEARGANATLDSLSVRDDFKALIKEGRPKGQRSEAIFAVVRALVKAGHDDATICAVLMDPVHGLSDKPREKGVAWLSAEVRRARTKPNTGAKSSSSGGRTNKADEKATYRSFTEIEMRPVSWLWPSRFARGKFGLLAGWPGLGKSQVGCYMAAVVSTGGHWPESDERCEPGNVLILSAEDDAEDTIKPRLVAAGAALERCYELSAVSDAQGQLRPLNLKRDLEKLDEVLAKIGGASLMIIDPLTAYLGGVDSHKDAEVRALLLVVKEWSERTKIAVVAIMHLTKPGQGTLNARALERVTGSGAFVAASRAVWFVAPDPNASEDAQSSSVRVFVRGKGNLAPDAGALAFKIVSHKISDQIETSRVEWIGSVQVSAEEALGGDHLHEHRMARDEAKDFLRERLADGPVPANDVMQEAKELGLADRTLKRAKSDLGVKSKLVGGHWSWVLSETA